MPSRKVATLNPAPALLRIAGSGGGVRDRVKPGFRFCSKTLRSSFESLRTNGGAVEIIGDIPFILSLVEAFIGFFSRIDK